LIHCNEVSICVQSESLLIDLLSADTVMPSFWQFLIFRSDSQRQR